MPLLKQGQTIEIIDDLYGHAQPIGSHHIILEVMEDDDLLPYMIFEPDRDNPNDIGKWIGDDECEWVEG